MPGPDGAGPSRKTASNCSSNFEDKTGPVVLG